MNLKSICCLAVLVGTHVVPAMNYSEFIAALEAAPDGGVVYLENDVEYTSALPAFTKRITITSPTGQTNTLRRAAAYRGRLMSVEDAAGDVTLSNITIDGNKSAGVNQYRTISVTNGVLTLASGATICNYDFSRAVGGIAVTHDGTLNMREGATIRDCSYSYYAMLLVGSREKGLARDGRFEMTGGRITGCAGSSTTAQPDFDGVVYLYCYDPKDDEPFAAVFDMSGGEITGNTSAHACAGVCVVSGQWNLSGTARIIGNNGGTVNDIHNTRGKILVAYGYAGKATVYTGSAAEPSYQASAGTKIVPAVTMSHFKGGENISHQNWPKWVLCSDYGGAYSIFYWEPLLALVDDMPCISILQVRDAIHDGCDICFAHTFTNASAYATFTIPQDVSCTVRGWPNERIAWHRGNYQAYFALLQTNSALRVENLVLDGDGDVLEAARQSVFYQYKGSAVTLGSGATITNVVRSAGAAVSGLADAGERFTIEEGAVITDCAVLEAGGYGTVLRVGNNAAVTPLPQLDMTGGMITNCRSYCTSAATSGYGGMIYVQKGVFNMSGGTIAGNTCGNETAGSCAGVQAYQGETYFSGNARIVNNTGKNPDLFRSGTATVALAGDFRGRVGISSGYQAAGQETVIAISEGATGAWCFYPSANASAVDLVGTPNDAGTKVKWAACSGTIDGVSIASATDAANLWPAEQTTALNDLPHVFTGVATAVDCAWTLDFDGEALKTAYSTPIVLAQAADGVFTGTWSFVTPTVSHARWEVRPVRSAAGITAWRLELIRRGTQVFLR